MNRSSKPLPNAGVADSPARIEWETRGKTIAGLMRELQTFADPNILVELSVDGETSMPISLVTHQGGKCVLLHFDPTED